MDCEGTPPWAIWGSDNNNTKGLKQFEYSVGLIVGLAICLT